VNAASGIDASMLRRDTLRPADPLGTDTSRP
jgi:hypothetical protein